MESKDPDDNCNTETDEETIALMKKRARRVSFSETTAVHFYDREEESDKKATNTEAAEDDWLRRTESDEIRALLQATGVFAVEEGEDGMMRFLLLLFFSTKPYACEPSSLPKYPPTKEMDAKLRDEEARRLRASKRATAESTKKSRMHDRGSRAFPAPEANAELQSNIDCSSAHDCEVLGVRRKDGLTLDSHELRLENVGSNVQNAHDVCNENYSSKMKNLSGKLGVDMEEAVDTLHKHQHFLNDHSQSEELHNGCFSRTDTHMST